MDVEEHGAQDDSGKASTSSRGNKGKKTRHFELSLLLQVASRPVH